MNENLDLTKILEGCPKGTKLYSPLFGEIEFERICDKKELCIKIKEEYGINNFRSDGTYLMRENGECLLFPSKDQRDWSKFVRFWDKPKVEKFDPNTLQPFDKVLIRNGNFWTTDFFSYIAGQWANCVGSAGVECVPYNEETKHLLGTREDCPEYYSWWKK